MEKDVLTSTEPQTAVQDPVIESSGARSEPHTEIMEKLFVLSEIIYPPALWVLKLELCFTHIETTSDHYLKLMNVNLILIFCDCAQACMSHKLNHRYYVDLKLSLNPYDALT